ncbi:MULTISPECIES: hypothetical protein [unclassified Pseudomonas]|jgi:hypothetical protein|uniref:hypothetical protein n=1 Tax=unclassified Pseudomonas TaxID=196821 RepID=UPI0009DB42FF|nr:MULTISPECIES: hypothetical protein [unclassified Pseudomonas]MBD9546137.1 hypothetical protein [Pseudomonas sp. PDM01]
MTLKVLAGLVIYLLVGVVYFFVHDYGVALYKLHAGGFTARGVSIGITAELTFYFFIFVNMVVFVLPKLAAKIVAIMFMVAVVLFYFLPENPVRAMAYSGLTSSMSLLALVARLIVDRLISRRNSPSGS